MSLSQRFEKADDKRRSGGQTNKNATVKIDATSKSPKSPKGGMKKSNPPAKQQKGARTTPKTPKSPKPARKGVPKPVKQKSKTADEMDMELDTYMVGKDKAMASKLDDEMDAYHASRSAEAESAPDS